MTPSTSALTSAFSTGRILNSPETLSSMLANRSTATRAASTTAYRAARLADVRIGRPRPGTARSPASPLARGLRNMPTTAAANRKSPQAW